MNYLKVSLAALLILGTLFSACKKDDPTPEETCSDGILNQDETDIDCGGVCTACAVLPTCTDGIKNGNETGVDCGGDCDPCAGPFAEFMLASINGTDFSANLVSGFDDATSIEFQSDQSQERQLFFAVPTNVAEGTHQLVNNAGYSAEYKKLFEGTYETESGSITITRNDKTLNELEGTFEFTAVQYSFGNPVDTITVTNGSFAVEVFN